MTNTASLSKGSRDDLLHIKTRMKFKISGKMTMPNSEFNTVYRSYSALKYDTNEQLKIGHIIENSVKLTVVVTFLILCSFLFKIFILDDRKRVASTVSSTPNNRNEVPIVRIPDRPSPISSRQSSNSPLKESFKALQLTYSSITEERRV